MGSDTFGTLPDEPEIPNRDRLSDEKELTGTYFSDNPLQRLTRMSNRGVSHSANQLDESLAGQSISLAGVITSARVITTKKGDPMAFIQLEDPTGGVEITVFPKTYAKTKELWRVEALATIKGKVELRDAKIQVLCESATELVLEDLPEGSEPAPREEEAGVVQIAMANDDEAALADVAMTDEVPADLPPPPEEPPSEFLEQQPVPRPAVAPQTAPGHTGRSYCSDRRGAGHSRVAAGSGSTASSKIRAGADPFRRRRRVRGHAAVRSAAAFANLSSNAPRIMTRKCAGCANFSTCCAACRDATSSPFSFPIRRELSSLDFPNFTTSYSVLQDSLNQLVGDWGSLEVQ